MDEKLANVPIWQPKYHVDKADEWELADRLLAVVAGGDEAEGKPYDPDEVVEACLRLAAKVLVADRAVGDYGKDTFTASGWHRPDPRRDLPEQEIEKAKALLHSHILIEQDVVRPLPEIRPDDPDE
jgi:hypothetical protein